MRVQCVISVITFVTVLDGTIEGYTLVYVNMMHLSHVSIHTISGAIIIITFRADIALLFVARRHASIDCLVVRAPIFFK